jgi:hypothetical protein
MTEHFGVAWTGAGKPAGAGAGTIAAHRIGQGPRRFYVWMAWICAAVAFAGFARTYWSPLARGAFAGPPIVHVHGLLFSAWTLVFILQARSAAGERYERHRLLGYLGIAVAGAMLFVGFGVVSVGIRHGIDGGFGEQARSFSIVPATILLSFAIAVAGALACVRRPETHMRLMLVATVALLPPAIARLLAAVLAPGTGVGMGFPPPPVAFSLLPSVLSDLLLGAAMVRDWKTDGRPHRVYLIAVALLVLSQIARVPFAGTAAWRTVTDGLLALAG